MYFEEEDSNCSENSESSESGSSCGDSGSDFEVGELSSGKL